MPEAANSLFHPYENSKTLQNFNILNDGTQSKSPS